MALPPGITKKLLQATSDKTDLNKQALRFNLSLIHISSGTLSRQQGNDRTIYTVNHTCLSHFAYLLSSQI